jgi:ATP-dependent helicase/nuclease subunit A
MTFQISDGAVREEVVLTSDRSYVVSAGAGTGKTQLIVDRIVVALLSGGVEPEELVAITFTEAAASELKARVRGELSKRADSSSTASAETERAKSVLSRLDSAKISTIHSFAQSVIAEFAFQAGVPVGFRVVEPTVYSSEILQRWREFAREYVVTDDTGAPLITVLDALGLNSRRVLSQIAVQVAERCPHLLLPTRYSSAFAGERDVADPDQWLADAIWDARQDRITSVLDEMSSEADFRRWAEALERALNEAELSQKALQAGVRCRYLADRLSSGAGKASSVEDLHNLAADFNLFHKAATAFAKSTSSSKYRSTSAAALAAEMQAWTKEILDALRQACASAVLAVVSRFVALEARRRRREGELTFSDLLTVALELIETRPEVRRVLSERYKYFLIDEFQDTDPIQVLLAFSILGLCVSSHRPGDSDSCSLAHDEHSSSLGDGRLVVVGDVKQSIYGFRGAKPKILGELSERWADSVRVLESNFRSRPEIVEFVNSVFSTAFSTGEEQARPTYSHLRPGRVITDGGEDERPTAPRVWLVGKPLARKAEEVRTEEMSHIASLIRSAVDGQNSSSWTIEKKSVDERVHLVAPTYSDIAVLIRSRTWLPALERVFAEQSIPYRLETGDLLYSTQEAADIRAVLRAVDDPTDSVGVVAALKSSVFACSDQDLIDYFESTEKARHAWQYTKQADLGSEYPDGSRPADATTERVDGTRYVASCMEVLEDLHDASRVLSPPHLLERLLRRQKLLEGSVMGRYRESWRRFRLIVDDCRRFFEETSGTLRDFIAWMKLMQEEGSVITESICPEPDDDSVRVLTIHGSKGLEFPIVFAVGAVGDSLRKGEAGVLVGGDGSIELRLGSKGLGIETGRYKDLSKIESDEALREEIRLGYVAFTRARDYLVVSLYTKVGKEGDRPERTPVGLELDKLLDASDHSPSPDRQSETSWRDIELDWGVIRYEPEMQDGSESGNAGLPRRPVSGQRRTEKWRLVERTRLVLQKISTSSDGLGLRLPVFSATEIAGLIAPYDFSKAGSSLGGEPDGQRDALALGRAVHETLARLDLRLGRDQLGSAIQDEVRSVLGALGNRGIPESTVRSLVQKALDLPIIDTAASMRHWKELFVCAPGPGGTAVEGFADLVIDAHRGLVVADYKTDSLSLAHDPDALVRHYSYQVAAYAYALDRATDRSIAYCTLLFLGDEDPAALEIEDLSTKISEIEELLQELADTRRRALEYARAAAEDSKAASM